jgi:hypothetical protein
MKKYFKIVLYGFLAWLVPFVSAFFFYTRDGKLNIDIFLFKTIMIIVGSFTGAILLVSYFKKVNENYLTEGVLIGVIWFCINILLDLVVLLPMSKMPIPEYFAQIGLRYLVMPAMSIAVGTALAQQK